jgi:DNA-binding MarR family transcriptional regulator/predicted enzyme related to lactoylglutathione lyase
MRAARGTYANAIRAQLQAAGIDDLPRNSALLLARLDADGGAPPDLPSDLGITKQAVSQLVDTLVTRGYLDRTADPDDRRRIALELTDRGRDVVAATVQAVEEVHRQLLQRVSPEQIDAMGAALLALAEIKRAAVTTGAGRPRPARLLRHFSPIFTVADLNAALAHYATLGFTTFADNDDTMEYGFANRDGTGIHLAAHPDHDVHHGAATYLYVTDADALYEQWTRPGVGGLTRPVGPTPYGLREGSHVDPDGNVIRFGSPLER